MWWKVDSRPTKKLGASETVGNFQILVSLSKKGMVNPAGAR
jgi:hypothetical protein